ncbi:MAG: nucleoside kinase, partial [Halanaerobium sp.]
MNINIDGEKLKIIEKSSIKSIIEESKIEEKKDVMAVILDNEICDLTEEIDRDAKIKTVKINSELGNRIYRRSLYLVLAKAVYELFPKSILKIEISISNGIYCELENKSSLSKSDLNKIKKRMQEIISADQKIEKHKLNKKEVLEIIKDENCSFRSELIKQQDKDYYILYELDGYYDYFYYNMVPSTSYLREFDLHLRIPGFVLLFPKFFSSKKVPKF